MTCTNYKITNWLTAEHQHVNQYALQVLTNDQIADF